MATARNYQDSDSDVSDSDYTDDSGDDDFIEEPKPCKFYNKSFCWNGTQCPYLHVCKFALRGSCRNGSNCHLSHDIARGSRRTPDTQTQGPTLTDGRFYQWQLCNGNSWMDIENDHVIEAQYILPNIKSLKLYNLPFGSVCIDFKRMKVSEKSFKVRRLDDGNTEWIWYVILRGKWTKYGDQGPTANPSPVNSCDIEQAFRANPRGSFTFDVRGETLEINFKKMQQFGKQTTRKVARRPLLKVKPGNAQIPQATPALQHLSLGPRAQWQFEGNNGHWHEFKRKNGISNVCSVNSNDIEAAYQQNPTGSMPFQVSGQDYTLDFAAMKQISTVTGNTRKIRRIQL